MTAHDASGSFGAQPAGGPGDTADLVRSVALTSARLWEEVLERLERVERSHVELREAFARLQATLPVGSEPGRPALGGAPLEGPATWDAPASELAPPSQPIEAEAASFQPTTSVFEEASTRDDAGAAHAARGLTAKDAVDLLFGDERATGEVDQRIAGGLEANGGPPQPWEGVTGTSSSPGSDASATEWSASAEAKHAYRVPDDMADALDALAPEPGTASMRSSWATFEPSQPEPSVKWSDETGASESPTWVLSNDEEPFGPGEAADATPPATAESNDWSSFALEHDTGAGFETAPQFEAPPVPSDWEPTVDNIADFVPAPPPGFESFGDVPPPPPGFATAGQVDIAPPPPPPPGFEPYGDVPPPPPGFATAGQEDVPRPPAGFESFGDVPPPPPGFESFGDVPPPPPPGFESFGDVPPPPPGFATAGQEDVPRPPAGFESFGDVPPPPPPGFESFGDVPPPPPGFESFGDVPPPPPGFESFGDVPPPPPGFAMGRQDDVPPPPPPPAGLESFGDVPPPPPAGFESFGDVPPPPPGFATAAQDDVPPPAGFATTGQVDVAPPPPPPGFRSTGDGALPPPPPGYANVAADFQETFASETAQPASDRVTPEPERAPEAPEVEDVPITPDFFARAGRRR